MKTNGRTHLMIVMAALALCCVPSVAYACHWPEPPTGAAFYLPWGLAPASLALLVYRLKADQRRPPIEWAIAISGLIAGLGIGAFLAVEPAHLRHGVMIGGGFLFALLIVGVLGGSRRWANWLVGACLVLSVIFAVTSFGTHQQAHKDYHWYKAGHRGTLQEVEVTF